MHLTSSALAYRCREAGNIHGSWKLEIFMQVGNWKYSWKLEVKDRGCLLPTYHGSETRRNCGDADLIEGRANVIPAGLEASIVPGLAMGFTIKTRSWVLFDGRREEAIYNPPLTTDNRTLRFRIKGHRSKTELNCHPSPVLYNLKTLGVIQLSSVP
ncbi:hypothetical protein J6590_065006 [Homalodisca vitripennis]|nr:hypothetical protein J6590_065006 [Homalodisca vitripennis]